jgi:hypothetical protein
MTKQAITNLHNKNLIKIADSNMIKNIQTRISEFGNQVKDKLPNLLGHVDLAGHLKLNSIKKKFLKKLDSKRKKFKLALESLGWGTLAALLEHAFNGDELNVIV